MTKSFNWWVKFTDSVRYGDNEVKTVDYQGPYKTKEEAYSHARWEDKIVKKPKKWTPLDDCKSTESFKKEIGRT